MDFRKINNQIIPLLLVITMSIAVAMSVRFVILQKGLDVGTANLVFLIMIGVCAIVYLAIVGIFGGAVVPWIMRKLPKPKASVMKPAKNTALPEKENPQELFVPSIAEIKNDIEKRHTEKVTVKIRVFHEYTHLTVGPYVSTESLVHLDNYIECFARDEELPKDVIPVRTEKLTNYDLFHFGWNMAEYFNVGKKYEVVSWLQNVFANLRDLEYFYIKGKLYTSQTKRFIIPNTDDIPKYIDKLKG